MVQGQRQVKVIVGNGATCWRGFCRPPVESNQHWLTPTASHESISSAYFGLGSGWVDSKIHSAVLIFRHCTAQPRHASDHHCADFDSRFDCFHTMKYQRISKNNVVRNGHASM